MGIVIDKITFENYRQYGTGSLSFRTEGDHKLSVLIAQNGTGKTTLLNAITWCLYNKELHLADESKALPLVNTAAAAKIKEGNKITVKVTLTIVDGANIVEFARSQDFLAKTDAHGKARYLGGNVFFVVTTTPASDFKNSDVKEGNDAAIVVKQYFDEAIFKFYFFDGEKLGEFFAPSQSNSIQQSIFNISQVTMLENACSRLKRMHNERTKKLAKNCPDLASLTLDQEKLEKKKSDAEKSLIENEAEVADLSSKRTALDKILAGYQPVKKLQQDRKELEEELNHIEMEESAFYCDRSAFVRKYVVLLNLYPRIDRTLQIIKEKENSGDLPPAIDKDQVRKMLQHLDQPCPLCNGVVGETGRQHLEQLMERISVSSHTSNFLKEIKAPLERYTEQVHQFPRELDSLRQREMDIASRKGTATEKMQKIASTLSHFESEAGEVDVANLEKERNNLIKDINAANQAIGAAKTTIALCNDRLQQLEEAIKKAMHTIGEHEEIRRCVDVVDELHDRFSYVKDQIMGEMKSEIEKTTWTIFDAMIWKKNTFGFIKISDTYDISVYNLAGTEMTGSLSATEQMALAYAFTLAIHRASGKNCPLVIDSPLGRVSDENRENMARALEEISREKQIIMLFTPDEYSPAVREMYSSVAEVRKLTLSEDESYVEGIER